MFQFPKDFLWGVRPGPWQKGGLDQDGKGDNLWDYQARIGTQSLFIKGRDQVKTSTFMNTGRRPDLLLETGHSCWRSIHGSRIFPEGRGRSIKRVSISSCLWKIKEKDFTSWSTSIILILPMALQSRAMVGKQAEPPMLIGVNMLLLLQDLWGSGRPVDHF